MMFRCSRICEAMFFIDDWMCAVQCGGQQLPMMNIAGLSLSLPRLGALL